MAKWKQAPSSIQEFSKKKKPQYFPVTAFSFFFFFIFSASIVLGISLIVYYPESLKGYVETNCTVIDKNLQKQPHDSNSNKFNYRAIFISNVTKVNSNETFLGEATHKRRKEGWDKKLESAEDVLENYEIGVQYVCCYDPLDLTSVIIGADLQSVQERFALLLWLSVLLYGVSVIFLGNALVFCFCNRGYGSCCRWSSCSEEVSYETL